MHDCQYAEDAENDLHNNWQKDYKCANYQGNHDTGSRDCEVWKKEKDYQTKTYSNVTYLEVRRMVETTKYAEMTKKYPNNQKLKLLYV